MLPAVLPRATLAGSKAYGARAIAASTGDFGEDASLAGSGFVCRGPQAPVAEGRPESKETLRSRKSSAGRVFVVPRCALTEIQNRSR